MALQCGIAHHLTKASIPNKTSTTNVVSKSEPKPSPVEVKPKEKKEETPEISLEANEKMMLDDDMSENTESKNERYVLSLLGNLGFYLSEATRCLCQFQC